MNEVQKGKLIVIYGVNNLGKTTQAKLLVESLLLKFSKQAEYLKYPIYTLEPTGTLVNDYLKHGNQEEFTAREFQMLQVLNRTQYEPTLKQKIEAGTWVVAEDYVGTGIAWGMAADVKKKLLYNLNEHLLKENLGILFEGEPFQEDLDKENMHETDPALLEKAATAFKEIAKDFGWITLNANQTREEVQAEILEAVKSKLSVIE
jgi:thymidylate kinase